MKSIIFSLVTFLFLPSIFAEENLVKISNESRLADSCSQQTIQASARVVDKRLLGKNLPIFEGIRSQICGSTQKIIEIQNSTSTICSASLIASDLVLTNAHCFGSYKTLEKASAESLCGNIGFKFDSPTTLDGTSENFNLVDCKRIEYLSPAIEDGGLDFAIVRINELNREPLVMERFSPVTEDAYDRLHILRFYEGTIGRAKWRLDRYLAEPDNNATTVESLTRALEDYKRQFEYKYKIPADKFNPDIPMVNFFDHGVLKAYGYPFGANLISSKLSYSLRNLDPFDSNPPEYIYEGFAYDGLSGSPTLDNSCKLRGILHNTMTNSSFVKEGQCYKANSHGIVKITSSNPIIKVFEKLSSGNLIVSDNSKSVLDQSRYSVN